VNIIVPKKYVDVWGLPGFRLRAVSIMDVA
jgi:hypothetical protein